MEADTRISTWITSREDLILSKVRDSGSEMQLRDVRRLIDESVDWSNPKDWAAELGVAAKLRSVDGVRRMERRVDGA